MITIGGMCMKRIFNVAASLFLSLAMLLAPTAGSYASARTADASYLNSVEFSTEGKVDLSEIKSGVYATAATPVLTFNYVPDMGTLPYGRVYNLSGGITCTQIITTFKGEIIRNGSVVQEHSYYPGTSSINIKTSPVNYNLSFGKLAPGSYTLKYTAVSGGKTFTCTKFFKISTETLKVDVTKAPSSINQGSAFNIEGTVSSYYNISSVTGRIWKGDTMKQMQPIYPNTTYVSLKTSDINRYLRFGILAKGKYTLEITAHDEHGNCITYEKDFTVK